MQGLAALSPPLAPRASARRCGARRAPLCPRAAANKKGAEPEDDNVRYGNGWYESTRRLSKRKSTAETLGACVVPRSRLPGGPLLGGDARAGAAAPHARRAAAQPSTSSRTSGCAGGAETTPERAAH